MLSDTYADNTKKKCLIGLYGLSRTFKTTSNLLFETIIIPNKDKYDFDIIINTDFESKGSTCGRHDTNSGVSTYKYANIESFKEDLRESYNKYNQLKKILIYNYDNNEKIFPWCLIYKRIQSILINAFENKTVYDLYIILRMDSVIDSILNIEAINNEILFITSGLTRPGFFHNRDTMDGAIFGNYKPFMYWIMSILNVFNLLVSKNKDTENFFSKEPFCEKNIIDSFNEIQNIFLNKEITDIQKKYYDEKINFINLKHTPCDIIDNYFVNNSIETINFCNFYNMSNHELFESILNCIRTVVYSDFSFVLSENKEIPIHSYIFR